MTDNYTFRDPKLSIWQSAAHDVQQRRKSENLAAPPAASTPIGLVHQDNPFMAPAHLVAHSLGVAGKSIEAVFHAVESGLLKLKPVFDPVDDCARTAALFLQAEVAGNEEDSATYSGQLTMGVCNGVGWAECVSTYLLYKAQMQNPVYRAGKNPVFDLKGAKTLAIIGDWGTGQQQAKLLLQQVAKMKPDILLHLGDVYFAATPSEVQDNFLTICRSTLGDIPIYSLCGNHDMYSGGKGYYSLLDDLGQQASYFCLQNDDWMFLAMDTGFHDNNPFSIQTNMTQLVTQGDWSEAAWHTSLLERAGNRKVVLLSHHQLFSPFGPVGYIGGSPYAYNPNLFQTFQGVLPKVEWWFWGHEHTLGIYDPYMGLKRGRCVGASAVPVFQDQQSYTPATGLKTLDGSIPTWNPDGVLGTSKGAYNNCFAIMTLTGASAVVEYFEVPQGGGLNQFKVTDKTAP